MFERLNTGYARAWHGKLERVVRTPDRIASRFRVEKLIIGQQTLAKSKCNFFELRGDLFEAVLVCTSGDNTLR